MTQPITFRVRAETGPNEMVCVSGNCDTLGHWAYSDVFPLQFTKDGNLWIGKTTVPSTVLFRYVICVILENNDNKRKVIIRRWETDLTPRTAALLNEVHQFGFLNGSNHLCIQEGWLTAQSVVQLKLGKISISTGAWDQQDVEQKFQVRISLVDLRKNGWKVVNDDDVPNSIKIAVMNGHECEFRFQKPFGRLYDSDECVIFQAQVETVEAFIYVIDLYLYQPNKGDHAIPQHFGSCHVLPSSLRGTSGYGVVPIVGKTKPLIGEVLVEYLIVHPMSNWTCDMQISYAKYWNQNRKPLEIGHRGSGSSFTDDSNSANIRENTIASFKHAAHHGADYIEFDVHLSKDHVPVIYHDYFIFISAKKKNEEAQDELFMVPVQELMFQQLSTLAVHHDSERCKVGNNLIKRQFDNDGDEDHQPFPSLRKAFESVDINVGFNVEIKRSLHKKDGTEELHNQIEENLYLDTILKEILANAGTRRIILSCFHPDICTMIRLKQNKYPVLLLTQGQTKRYPPYLDPRTSSIQMAIYHAKSTSILGIDVQTEEILEDKTLVEKCKNEGLIMFCWGKDNNDPDVILELKRLGLNGIIYDRIDVLKIDKENVFAKEAKFVL